MHGMETGCSLVLVSFYGRFIIILLNSNCVCSLKWNLSQTNNKHVFGFGKGTRRMYGRGILFFISLKMLRFIVLKKPYAVGSDKTFIYI